MFDVQCSVGDGDRKQLILFKPPNTCWGPPCGTESPITFFFSPLIFSCASPILFVRYTVLFIIDHLGMACNAMRGTVIENNIYFSNLLILVEDHPVVLSLPSHSSFLLFFLFPSLTQNKSDQLPIITSIKLPNTHLTSWNPVGLKNNLFSPNFSNW